jgi:hypothetical protein
MSMDNSNLEWTAEDDRRLLESKAARKTDRATGITVTVH